MKIALYLLIFILFASIVNCIVAHVTNNEITGWLVAILVNIHGIICEVQLNKLKQKDTE